MAEFNCQCGKVLENSKDGDMLYIFDEQEISDAVVRAVCARKGIAFEPAGSMDLTAYKNQQYDLLADAVRSNLDMELVRWIMKL